MTTEKQAFTAILTLISTGILLFCGLILFNYTLPALFTMDYAMFYTTLGINIGIIASLIALILRFAFIYRKN